MKLIKLVLVAALIPICLATTSAHKFYVSITKVEYAAEDQALQLISKIFVDDLEVTLSERYGREISLGTNKETATDLELLKKYFLQKFSVEVNGQSAPLIYLGQEYENDTVKIYIEIEEVASITSLEFENSVLLDKFEEQQNIIHTKVFKKRRSLVLDKDNPKGLLNFD